MLSNNQSGGNVTFVKLKSPKGKTPYFVEQIKNGDHWEDGEEHYNKVSGTLVSIKNKPYVYEGKNKKAVQMEFDSDAGRFVVSSNFTNVARSIINTIAGARLDGLSNLDISVYTNKKGYASAYIEENGEKVGWKYGMEHQPKVEEFTRPNGDVEPDFTALDNFYEKVVDSIAARLPKNENVSHPPVESASAPTPEVPEPSFTESSELPF